MKSNHILCLVALSICSILHAEEADQVSYFKQIRPIFQANCQGCHQPAKQGGEYVMTTFNHLVAAGESGDAAIVPSDPEASNLIAQITPTDGEALMPKGKKALAKADIDLIRKWIQQGAKDDSPETAGNVYDVDHPPVYTRPPVISSLDYSPDGKVLAISGFHEVLLHTADGSKLIGRLIGMSERVETVRFSPDGKRLVVAGGNPARTGELQIWNVEKQELELSIPLTFDTVYGANWSPDGSLVSVGCSDATVRAFNSQTGEQVFFNGAHDDWPLDTVFSADGKHIVSVGRDMSTKLYRVETERFIDNVTSITPGALKGGILTIDRHPEQDLIAVGGSDGSPRIYRMERVTKRVIGDDANLMRQFESMKGRIFAVAYAPDGKTISAASSLNGNGQVATFNAEIDFAMPAEIKKIVEERVQGQNAEQKKQLEEYITQNNQPIAVSELKTGIYALSYSPDGKQIAAAGSDGTIRIIDPANGTVMKEFVPVEVTASEAAQGREVANAADEDESLIGDEKLPSGTQVTKLEVSPEVIQLNSSGDYDQVLVTGVLNTEDRIDLTRMVEFTAKGDGLKVSRLGRVTATSDGKGSLEVKFGDKSVDVPVEATGVAQAEPVSFVQDVNPVLSRLGCNQGTCHGAKDGKNGFKLSLRGYDPIFDVRAFFDDHKSRRINVASPDDSLMLLKATGAVPHVGGQLTTTDSTYYDVIRSWIADGAKLDLTVPRVESITVDPQNPVVQDLGARQQIRVVAKYSDGSSRDVTREAFIESGNTEVAEVNRVSVVTAIRRGEAPLLARYEGKYAATTLTVMGNRDGFAWQEPETWNEVDKFVASKWQRMKLLPSELCTDDEFIRRAYLDLTGLPPTADEVVAFRNDSRSTREKRDELVDKLIGSEPFVEYWTNKWSDLLQVNGKFLGGEGAKLFRNWIRTSIADNKPYDEFCYEILTADGSNKTNPAASYYKILRDPDVMMENTTHLFLAVRFNCNKCHDHPFERWTQDQYYETAAYFAQVGLKRDPENSNGNIGGTAVEGAKPLWEVVFDKSEGEITHNRTGAVTAPQVPYDRDLGVPAELSRREQLAKWITAPENDYFARSYVNRVWGYLMGVGLIEPLDDIRAGNPPTNPELLDWLTEQFVASDFDVRELMATICKSRTYQLSVGTHQWNEGDNVNYSHAVPKRLPAEVLYDSVYYVTGADMNIPGVPKGTRAAALPDVGVKLKDGFLANLGRPARESACECERSSDLQLGPVMALMNGPTVSEAISQNGNAIAKLVEQEADNRKLVNQIFLRVLNRPAEQTEITAAIDLMNELDQEHAQLVAKLEAYRKEIAPVTAAKEAKRQDLIKEAEQTLAAYQEEIKPREEQKAKEREQKIAAAQKVVDDHLASAPERLKSWEEAAISSQTGWTSIAFNNMKSTNDSKLENEDGNIVFVSGPNNKKGAYALSGAVDAKKITALKLELLTDDRLPSRGPGRAQNGNFVLTELTLQAWPKGKPDQKKQIKLKNAKADFSQDNYGVETAIDGKKPNASNGWATSPRVGEDRFATFELETPLEFEEGAVLHFTMDQLYQDNTHTIGKFRISMTGDEPPVDFGHPKNIVEIVKTATEQRSEEQSKQLLDYFNQRDEELQKKRKALVEAQKPVPVDPKLVELQNELQDRQKPLPVDPQLARLERAVKLSESQQQNSRLTVAQDLTWALINSPAFLFNR